MIGVVSAKERSSHSPNEAQRLGLPQSYVGLLLLGFMNCIIRLQQTSITNIIYIYFLLFVHEKKKCVIP